jgi:hypothetical protein
LNSLILISLLILRTEVVTTILIIIFLILLLNVFIIIWSDKETRNINRNLFLKFLQIIAFCERATAIKYLITIILIAIRIRIFLILIILSIIPILIILIINIVDLLSEATRCVFLNIKLLYKWFQNYIKIVDRYRVHQNWIKISLNIYNNLTLIFVAGIHKKILFANNIRAKI